MGSGIYEIRFETDEWSRESDSQVARVTKIAARHTISRALKKPLVDEKSKEQEGVSKKLECMLLLVSFHRQDSGLKTDHPSPD